MKSKSICALFLFFTLLFTQASSPLSADELYNTPFLLESEKELLQILEPLQALNKTTNVEEIARTTATFRTRLNDIYYSELSEFPLDSLFSILVEQFEEIGLSLDRNMFHPFIKKIMTYESELLGKGMGKNIKVKIPPQAALGSTKILCGSLLCSLPFSVAQEAAEEMMQEGIEDLLPYIFVG